jgi:hypothetical protein
MQCYMSSMISILTPLSAINMAICESAPLHILACTYTSAFALPSHLQNEQVTKAI